MKEKDVSEQEKKILGQVKAGFYLRSIRTERELSLVSLGKELNVSAAYLSGVEQGTKTMSDYFVRIISDFYKIDENIIFELLDRVPLLAREQLEENKDIQELLAEIKTNKKLSEDKKQKLFQQMIELYKNFPE